MVNKCTAIHDDTWIPSEAVAFEIEIESFRAKGTPRTLSRMGDMGNWHVLASKH